MEGSKKNKITLIILAILIIIAISIIIVVNKKNKIIIQEEEINGPMEEEPKEFENGFVGIKDIGMYNVIQEAVSNFLSAQNLTITPQESNETNPNAYRASTQKEKDQIIYDMLDAEYAEEKGITENNVSQYLPQETYTSIIPFETRVKRNDRVDMYLAHVGLVQGNVLVQENEPLIVKQKMYLVRIDKQNKTYSIEPLSDDNMEINTVQVSENNKDIRQNTYNKYTTPDTISTQMVAQKYFNHLKMILANCPQIMYNNYLTDEYKQKRFGSVENLERYSNLNKYEISNLQLERYKIETEGNKTKYIVQDQYKNTYEFIENYVMEYTVKIDDYTIPSESLIKQYNSASEKEKISLNVDRVIKMINSRDFYGMYNTLDETYRAKNFPTLEEFEQYIKNKYTEHYDYTIANNLAEKNTYILDLNIKSMESNVHEAFRIIMQLGDELNFKISFEK